MALEFTDEEFDQVLQKARVFYAAIGPIYCPYFHASVQFNTQGFEHLRHKAWNRGRQRRDQFMRLRHLAQAPVIAIGEFKHVRAAFTGVSFRAVSVRIRAEPSQKHDLFHLRDYYQCIAKTQIIFWLAVSSSGYG